MNCREERFTITKFQFLQNRDSEKSNMDLIRTNLYIGSELSFLYHITKVTLSVSNGISTLQGKIAVSFSNTSTVWYTENIRKTNKELIASKEKM